MRATEQTGVTAAEKARATLLASTSARCDGCGWLLLFTLLLWRGQEARAADLGQPRLVLEVPRELHVGEHAHVELLVDLPPEAAEPLLVTPYREGEALEVVKGRLLRSDARDPTAKPLRFALPVLARAAGSALIGVRLLAYVCAPRCRAIEAETRANVLVLPR
jgi:hypothetical protein